MTSRLTQCQTPNQPERLNPGRDQIGKGADIVPEQVDDCKSVYPGDFVGIRKLIDDFDGDTYRAVYTVRFRSAVYVLHTFKKKSNRGIKTPQRDIDLIRQRLAAAEIDHASRTKPAPKK